MNGSLGEEGRREGGSYYLYGAGSGDISHVIRTQRPGLYHSDYRRMIQRYFETCQLQGTARMYSPSYLMLEVSCSMLSCSMSASANRPRMRFRLTFLDFKEHHALLHVDKLFYQVAEATALGLKFGVTWESGGM